MRRTQIKPVPWGSPSEIETRRRIRLAVAAYVYEEFACNTMSDGDYDKECLLVDLSIKTSRPDMDLWFKRNFDPSTGMWVKKHPDRAGLHRIAKMLVPDLPDFEG